MFQKIRPSTLWICCGVLSLIIGGTIAFFSNQANDKWNAPEEEKIVLKKHHLLGFVTSIKDNAIHIQDLTQKKKTNGTHTILVTPQTRFSYRLTPTNGFIKNDIIDYMPGDLADVHDGFYIYITTLDNPAKTATITPLFIVYSIYPFENTYVQ